jgi:hypothetical protein
MPKFLEDKLKAEYPNNPHAVFGTMNAIGAMHGNKVTPKGTAMQAKHQADIRSTLRKRLRLGKVEEPDTGGETEKD